MRARLHGERSLEAPVAPVREIIGHRARVGDADTSEGQPLLALEIPDLLGRPVRQRVALGGIARSSVKAGVEQARDRGRVHRSVGVAHAAHLDLHHRLEPEEPARSIADQFDLEVAALRFLGDRSRRRVGTDRSGGRILGHEDPGSAAHACLLWRRNGAISSSKRCGETRPCSSSSIMSEGPSAQLPRQKTGSRVTAPSALVP